MPEYSKRTADRKKSVKLREKSPTAQSELVNLLDVTRSVPPPVQKLLWGIAAGRCEFEGCNERVWKNDLTQDIRVIGQNAHIRAFSARGPRGEQQGNDEGIHRIDNLILLCPRCHVTIDTGDGQTKYGIERVRAMKIAHEARIDAACAIAADRVSHVLAYTTHVGAHHALPTQRDANAALLDQRRYASSTSIDLSTRDGADPALTADFWRREANRLSHQFDRQVRQPLERSEIHHISVFALAPQPLLIHLGTLLGDILPVESYQRHREPPSWAWPVDGQVVDFEVREPSDTNGQPALVLSISATITQDRIQRAAGADASIWCVTVSAPNNDVVRSPETLAAFRAVLRPLLDRIKAKHGHQALLHVFPAMPVSLAVEFGRVRMPKADMPWLLYDEQSSMGGFVPTLTIELGA